MDTMYLDNLDEYIVDEQKIVTYKWLSLTLNVGANTAKQMLYHYVDKQRKDENSKPLQVTYLVSGVIEEEDGSSETLKVTVVREDSLDKIKSKMKSIASVHIYSVQSGTQLKDLNVLYSVDYDTVKENLINSTKYSGIQCEAAQIKSAEDLAQLQQKSAYKPPPEPERTASKGTIKGPSNKPDTTKSKNSGGIASMFMNQAKNNETKKSPNKSEPTKKSPTKSETTKKSPEKKKSAQGGMAAFLSKGPPAKKIKVECSETSAVSSVSTSSKSSEEIKVKEEPMEVIKSSTKEVKTYSKKDKSTDKKKAKSSKKSSEDPMPKNKRKRIMQMSDSESSEGEDSNNEEDESPMPSSPPPATLIESDEEVLPATPQQQPKVDITSKGGRCRKMKQVDKTFTDDDGFLITKKVYECVSGSESEEEKPKPKPVKAEKSSPVKDTKPTSKKKTRSPGKTTQSSITSFFKKK